MGYNDQPGIFTPTKQPSEYATLKETNIGSHDFPNTVCALQGEVIIGDVLVAHSFPPSQAASHPHPHLP